MSTNQNQSTVGKICLTRGMKNLKYIQSIAPDIFAKAKDISSIIPLETLNKLHTIINPEKVTKWSVLYNVGIFEYRDTRFGRWYYDITYDT